MVAMTEKELQTLAEMDNVTLANGLTVYADLVELTCRACGESDPVGWDLEITVEAHNDAEWAIVDELKTDEEDFFTQDTMQSYRGWLEDCLLEMGFHF